MKVLTLVLTLAALSIAPLSAQDSPGGILYGPNWACLVQAPSGWVLDNQAWAKYGIHAIFYLRGTQPRTPNPIIYLNSGQLQGETDQALDDYIKTDISGIANDPNNVIKELDKYKTREGTNIRRFLINYKKRNQLEEVAYLRYKDGAHLVVLTTQDEGLIKKNETKLFEVIDSLRFMDASVEEKQ